MAFLDSLFRRKTPAAPRDPIDDMVPDAEVASYVGGGDVAVFKQVGKEILHWLREFGGLRPDERVLEVGCGIGRIAIPLTQYLSNGSYVGFDIVKHGIDWCRERITPRYPNFTFFHSDIYNKAYNPTGRQLAHEYAFPFHDRSFEFVFLTSVFTHMLPRDVERYAAEIGRVLAPGGRVFCTAYLVDEEGRRHLERGESLKKFVDSGHGYLTDSPEVPEAATAYPEDYLLALFRAAGLEVRRVVHGEWWKYASAQDFFVAEKPRSTQPEVDFLCNVCGNENRRVLMAHAENRECQSCRFCGSSLRMRSLMYLLSMELFGKPMTLPEFPADKRVSGLGMSDWDGYAIALAGKLDYVNTFYHREPRLDIADIGPSQVGRNRFLISSDVFEHIPPAQLDAAFRNSRRLLRDDGFFLFTVPFAKEGETREHYPRLHEFAIVEEGGTRRLRNRTVEGDEEVFDDLIFHGGEGMTLEMRMFSEADLRRRLSAAGFSSVRVRGEHYAPFGIFWPIDHSLPIVARA